VPEGRQVFPNLSVRENLVATASRGSGSWNFEAVLELFPALRERAASLGGLLSGGEQQVLAIGRALMTNPRPLLLDEATEGLAPRIRAEIWRVLATLKGAGQSILLEYRAAAAARRPPLHPRTRPHGVVGQLGRAGRRRRPAAPLSGGLVALALQALAQQFAVAAHRLGFFAGAALGRLFVIAPQLHFPEHPFALHFFLQGPEGLVDIVIANDDLHGLFSPSSARDRTGRCRDLTQFM
jgi:hypothetical protein